MFGQSNQITLAEFFLAFVIEIILVVTEHVAHLWLSGWHKTTRQAEIRVGIFIVPICNLAKHTAQSTTRPPWANAGSSCFQSTRILVSGSPCPQKPEAIRRMQTKARNE